MADRQQTILCVSTYEKGTEFFRTCKQMGWRVLLLTVEKSPQRRLALAKRSTNFSTALRKIFSSSTLIYTVSYMARPSTSIASSRL